MSCRDFVSIHNNYVNILAGNEDAEPFNDRCKSQKCNLGGEKLTDL